jgi:hypothetical protein
VSPNPLRRRHGRALGALAGALVLGALCVGLGGCWAAALQLLPVGLSAAGAVGNGAMNLATNSSGSHDLHAGEDEVDRHERCDNLEETAPVVIELRRADATSAPQWRELQIANATGQPRWAAAAGPDGGPQWRASQNLLQMNFAPPLALPAQPNISTYLGYAPSEPQTSVEQDELTGLTANFGAPVGTFQWNGRTYQYATTAKLPCFPLDVAIK